MELANVYVGYILKAKSRPVIKPISEGIFEMYPDFKKTRAPSTPDALMIETLDYYQLNLRFSVKK